MTNNLDATRTITANYDSLNRIANALTTNWGEAYTIDAWGNMTAINSYQGKVNEPFSCGPANLQNQLNTCYGYDSAGNLVLNSPETYTYNAENRLVSTEGWTYVYDGDGNRVRKFNSVSGTLHWPDTTGKVLGETDQTGSPLSDYVLFNGQRIARFDPNTLAVHYYFSDHLGTHTVVTNATGTCEQDIEFYPYGGQRQDYCTTPVAQHYKFTGKERDSESNLDNFGARYYGSSLGRFMTADDPLIYASKNDPQTWNLYSYVRNGPLNHIDPNGRLTIIVPGTGWVPSDWNTNMKLVSEGREMFHDDDVRILPWSGHLGAGAISEGGQMLRDMVAGHNFGPNEQLNVITHSRGGEVGLDASLGIHHPIDNLITLAPTNWSQDYNIENILNWENISVKQDWVVLAASNLDPKHYPHANNLILDAPNNYGHRTAHSAVWQDDGLRKLWWAFWQQNARCHDLFDWTTNTLHGCR